MITDIKQIHDILLGGSNRYSNAEFPAKCYRCVFEPTTKEKYHCHLFDKHRHLSGYPNLASIHKYGLIPQGYWWEH